MVITYVISIKKSKKLVRFFIKDTILNGHKTSVEVIIMQKECFDDG